MAEPLEETRASLDRVQNFDTASLPRAQDLGSALSFKDAVEPTTRIVKLFQQFPPQYLDELPPTRLAEIKRQADSFFSTPCRQPCNRQQAANLLLEPVTRANRFRVSKLKKSGCSNFSGDRFANLANLKSLPAGQAF
ncbi:MAG TPA: hypothetical protein VGM57_07140 [Pseudolabrys sp.]|jgi:hypothetical protein